MALRDNPSWIEISASKIVQLINRPRLPKLLGQLANPQDEYPAVLLFLGGEKKVEALQELGLVEDRKIKPSRTTLASLWLDAYKFTSQQPVFVAESDPSRCRLFRLGYNNKSSTQSVPWAHKLSIQEIYDTLHARLIYHFADVICVFEDDFRSPDELVEMLKRWTRIGLDKSSPSIKPQLIVVRHASKSASPTLDLLKMEESSDRFDLDDLKQSFSLIKILHLATDPISPFSRYSRLGEWLRDGLQSIRSARQRKGCLYSASHIGAFFDMATRHVCVNTQDPFDFVTASRQHNQVGKVMIDCLTNFLGFTKESNIRGRLEFVASALMLDGYNPRSHNKLMLATLYPSANVSLEFPVQNLFDSIYKPILAQAIRGAFGDAELAAHHRALAGDELLLRLHERISTPDSKCCGDTLLAVVRKHMIGLFREMSQRSYSAKETFKQGILTAGIDWSHLKNNNFCMCLRSLPSNVLTCGHALCDDCIRSFGDARVLMEDQYCLEECPLCRHGKILIALRPVTAGIRLLSLDGGGVRGKITVLILKLLQERLQGQWRIQDLVDVVYGTSVGGLISLILFRLPTPVDRVAGIFDTLAMQLFPARTRPRGAFRRVWGLVKSWYHDGIYDAGNLERRLKDTLGETSLLFGPTISVVAHKLGVIAATIGTASPIVFTNYNISGVRGDRSYYKCIYPAENKSILAWQAARATSAAPVLFPCTSIQDIGDVQDGGMSGHNNPMRLARSQCLLLEPSLPDVDVAISIGTGEAPPSDVLTNTWYRHVLLDGFLPRVWRAYMSNSFDGDQTFKEVFDATEKERLDSYFRLNVPLPVTGVGMDDTSKLDIMEDCVKLCPDISSQVDDAVFALLAASFYFRLTRSPLTTNKGFTCFGSIRCRIPGRVMADILSSLKIDFSFTLGTQQLDGDLRVDDICRTCGKFQRYVRLDVQDIDKPICIYVFMTARPRRRLSAFPQSLRWFMQQQGLEAPFGAPGCYGTDNENCTHCAFKSANSGAWKTTKSRKRRAIADNESSRKRAKLHATKDRVI